MANKKINDLSPAGAVGDTMQYETDIGGTTANKVTSPQIKDYVNAGKAGGKTIEGGTAASENLILDSTSNATKGTIDVALNNTLRTNTIGELTTDNGIGVTVSGNTGAFYDYPTPHNTWFTFSASGVPDDGANIYIPYSPADDWWFGFGMGATDQFNFGTNGTEITMTGDGQLKTEQLTLATGQQVNNISTATDLGGGASSNDNLATQLSIKTYVDGHSTNNIWTRTGTDITVTNVGDNIDLSTAGVKIDSVASVFNVVAATGITPVNDMIIPIQSSTAGDTNITATPQIVAGTNGQLLTLIGVDDIKTVTLDDGDGLALDNGQSFTLGQNDIIEFVFYNSLWIETTRKDN
jgi:hypothetical protein